MNGSDYGRMGDGIARAIKGLVVLAALGWALALGTCALVWGSR